MTLFYRYEVLVQYNMLSCELWRAESYFSLNTNGQPGVTLAISSSPSSCKQVLQPRTMLLDTQMMPSA